MPLEPGSDVFVIFSKLSCSVSLFCKGSPAVCTEGLQHLDRPQGSRCSWAREGDLRPQAGGRRNSLEPGKPGFLGEATASALGSPGNSGIEGTLWAGRGWPGAAHSPVMAPRHPRALAPQPRVTAQPPAQPQEGRVQWPQLLFLIEPWAPRFNGLVKMM